MKDEQLHALNPATTALLLLSLTATPHLLLIPALQAPGPNVPPAAGARKGLLDNYDDAEGYYNFQVGTQGPVGIQRPGLRLGSELGWPGPSSHRKARLGCSGLSAGGSTPH